ncbi:hypothetical protein HTVC115P_gp19 [Pelagibacter phage HTVC115P]|nr:hypothetical protein HTVC115P_gp19 [Pelagibacter phage HTVC115P]
MSEDKKPKVTIVWGSDCELTRTYIFEDEKQKAFFMKGVDEAVGYLEYQEATMGHETISYEQTSEPKNRLEQMATLTDPVSPE